jgi:hypothetical protein
MIPMSNQKQIRITFSEHSKNQQAIFEYLKDEPSLTMTALVNQYSFLALAEKDCPEKELAKALIQSNAALMKAIEINNAIAARQGITIAAVPPPSIPLASLSPKAETPEDDDDDWDTPEPPKQPAKLTSNQEVMSRL